MQIICGFSPATLDDDANVTQHGPDATKSQQNHAPLSCNFTPVSKFSASAYYFY
jgi:hypothetical protein